MMKYAAFQFSKPSFMWRVSEAFHKIKGDSYEHRILIIFHLKLEIRVRLSFFSLASSLTWMNCWEAPVAHRGKSFAKRLWQKYVLSYPWMLSPVFVAQQTERVPSHPRSRWTVHPMPNTCHCSSGCREREWKRQTKRQMVNSCVDLRMQERRNRAKGQKRPGGIRRWEKGKTGSDQSFFNLCQPYTKKTFQAISNIGMKSWESC